MKRTGGFCGVQEALLRSKGCVKDWKLRRRLEALLGMKAVWRDWRTCCGIKAAWRTGGCLKDLMLC
jgi:hypothetical protein